MFDTMDRNASFMSSPPTPKGITAANRRLLATLLRSTAGPFTIAEAGKALDLSPERARRLLAYLAQRGWLTRVRRGLYTPVPLEAAHPSEWREDPWVVAAELFAPCYIGGWSACEHWSLTDQLFRDVVVFSGRWLRDRTPTVQDTTYRVKVVSPERLFGTRTVWRGPVQVPVSDPSRTLIDLLDDPSMGGGIRHVAEVLHEWFTAAFRDDALLIQYAERHGNRSVYKRLGYLVEALGLDAPELVRSCRARMSRGVVQLDPSGPAGGRRVSRWNLRVNVRIEGRGG
jgi:predicted transcriptional regulator of viral defense system